MQSDMLEQIGIVEGSLPARESCKLFSVEEEPAAPGGVAACTLNNPFWAFKDATCPSLNVTVLPDD